MTLRPRSPFNSLEDPLTSIWPHLVPSGITTEQQEHADAAVAGNVMFLFHGYHATEVGRKGVDWTGKHRKHQEWPAQLNRFFMLRALFTAWHITNDEKYAAAARDYIEDWIEAHPTKEVWAGSGSQRAFCFVVVVNEECEGGLMHAMAFGKRSGFSN
jgi:hypothetical protein